MTPPPALALLLLACWALMVFAVTNQTGHDQYRAARRSDPDRDADDPAADARWSDPASTGAGPVADD